MIRVNLLPQKRQAVGRTRTGDGQGWLLVVLGVILVQIVGIVLFHKSKQDELAIAEQENRKVELVVADIKRQIANHDTIKAQLKELRDREEAIPKLQAARTGPTAILLEISHILTAGRGPTVPRDKIERLRQTDPSAVPNPNWDPRRLWLTQYVEAERAMKLAGLARDGEDVSEFLRRLTLSDYFYDVKLLRRRRPGQHDGSSWCASSSAPSEVLTWPPPRSTSPKPPCPCASRWARSSSPWSSGCTSWCSTWTSPTVEAAQKKKTQLDQELVQQKKAQRSCFADRDGSPCASSASRAQSRLRPRPRRLGSSPPSSRSQLERRRSEGWQPLEEREEAYYARVPMRLELGGRYQQMAKFVYEVGRLDRIINVENIELVDPKLDGEEVRLKARCLVTSFRAPKPKAQPAKAGGAR